MAWTRTNSKLFDLFWFWFSCTRCAELCGSPFWDPFGMFGVSDSNFSAVLAADGMYIALTAFGMDPY